MMTGLRWRSTLWVLVATALIAAACGGGSSNEASSGPEDEVAAFFAAVREISTESNEIVGDAFEAFVVQTEGVSFESLLPEYSAALDEAIAARLDAIDRYEALEPPEQFVADHRLEIEFVENQIDAWGRMRAAAEEGDTEQIAQIQLELDSLERTVLTGVSAEYAEAIVSTDIAIAAAELFGDLGEEEAAYLDAVATGWDEFGRRSRVFSRALEQSYMNDDLLLMALLDAGAGQAFAAARDAIVGIDPPESYLEGHARLMQYLDEAVVLDTAIGAAAEAGDVVGFEVANYGLGLAAGRFSLEAPPSLASVLGDPVNLVTPEGLPGDDYGVEAWEILQQFRILALRRQTNSGVFPIVSDENLAATIAIVYPTAIQLTEETQDEFAALNPPAELRAGHESLATYFERLIELRRTVLDAAANGDIETLESYGELGGFAAERAETHLWCTAGQEIAEGQYEPITQSFFRPFSGVATVGQLCEEN